MKHFWTSLGAAFAVVLLCSPTLAATPLHAARSAPRASNAGPRCFPETGLCISGRIREYWEQNGGLAVFGYPTSRQQPERVEANTFEVQHFERNRLELHPENAPPYDVLLGRLGAEQIGRLRIASLSEEPLVGCLHFPQTQHVVCEEFAEAWRRDGLELDGRPGKLLEESLALFGLPVTGRMTMALGDGKSYQVQYFERARFEYHPENAAPYNVLFGLLDNEARLDTAPPRPQTLLPAPLFFLYSSQILRLERDGLTQTPVVDERQNGEIVTFSASPNGVALAYVLKSADGYRLMRTDIGYGNRFEIYLDAGPISVPRWSPDSRQIAVHIGALEVGQSGALYIFTVGSDGYGMDPALPDDNQHAPAMAYLPDSWSPDGQSLLVSALPKQPEGCTPMLFDLGSRQLGDVPTPGGIRAACGAAWSATGREVYFSAMPQQSPFSATGLWRINLQAQVVTPLVRAQEATHFNLFGSIMPRADGATSALLAKSSRLPQLGDSRPTFYAPYVIGPTGAQIRQYENTAFELQDIVAWAPDGNGFLCTSSFGDPAGRVRVVWVPFNGGPPYEVNATNGTVAWDARGS